MKSWNNSKIRRNSSSNAPKNKRPVSGSSCNSGKKPTKENTTFFYQFRETQFKHLYLLYDYFAFLMRLFICLISNQIKWIQIHPSDIRLVFLLIFWRSSGDVIKSIYWKGMKLEAVIRRYFKISLLILINSVTFDQDKQMPKITY